ncbi:CusA/CzcA family heavy metal efflux RND transporter [Candidatus Poribacteria bacterium]|nr:CusA/CzcA family heavy metal efflux RND transporter [Candidatus Poribacteria bacterium]
MLEKLIEICIKNKFFVILLTLIITGWGIWALFNIPIDAIPDLSDVQVIIYTEWMGQSPQEIEDQVTYPLSKAMLAVPKVRAVRGYSFFSVSFVYVIFEDRTNLYWARSRVLEYLNTLQGKLPAGVTPTLGPDATGVGWVFQYTVEGKGYNLAELRAIQDWYIRYQIASVPGVAEVASVGGFKKQYQVDLDPNKLIAYGIPINNVMMAIRSSNRQIGASMLEMSETEFMVRGLGYFKSIEDIKDVVVSASPSGTPTRVRDIAYVYEGPEMRRGIAEKDGQGEVVGATVVMRHGKNALEVIKRVKQKIKEIEPGLPKGVKIVPVYDRTKLIYRAIDTLKQTLIEETIVVTLVCVVFLWHLRSAFVSIITLPLGILISLIIMRYQGINANIMSLGGIAIAIGAMVDASIVMVENVHKMIEHEGERRRDIWEIITESSKQVGPSLFFSLMIVAVSFLPVFTLQAQEGRLFSPLAFTKGYAMGAGAILAITLVPVLMGYLIRGKIKAEEKNPVNRFLIWLYRPIMYQVLRFRWVALLLAIAALIATIYPLRRLGSEFMPPLNEGDILYMPNTAPGVSVTQARQVLQLQDQILRQFPMVETVFGKMGRMETATDPAPLDMVETVVTLKPVEEWPKKKGRFFSRTMTIEDIMNEMDAKLKLPGVGNIWVMPIKTRIDMLATGIKTPVGVKVYGSDLNQIIDLAIKIEDVLRKVPGTRNVFAERLMSGNYVDFEINRKAAARYGLTVGDVQDVIQSAIGGMPITTTVEGRARFPVSIRYARELRDDVERLKRVLVPIAPMMGSMGTPMSMSSTPVQMGSSMSMGQMQNGSSMSGMGGATSSSMGMSPTPMTSMPLTPMLPMSTQLNMGGSMGMGTSGSMGMSPSMPSTGAPMGMEGGASMGLTGSGWKGAHPWG